MYDRLSRYYDRSHAALTADIPFMLALAAETGGPVLELGCGSGRLLVPLARAGHAVTGVDNSPAMLALAERRLAAEPPAVRERVRLVAADMTAAYLPDEAATMTLALVGVNTFLHLAERPALAALRAVARLLRPGGTLCLDVDNPFTLAAIDEPVEPAVEAEWTDPEGGRTVRQWAAYGPAEGEQAVDVTWTFEEIGPGALEPTTVVMRYHYSYPHQLDLLLTQSGLRLAALYGDYDRAPFAEDSERLLLLARRP
jgi:SAM-dependent methyltransferase